MKKRALISVSDKRGVLAFARAIAEQGYELISTGGTYGLLKQNGLDVVSVSELTGFPELLDGRVKTLHPAIHGGLLALRNNPGHMAEIEKQAIAPIDLVVVNLYPFKESIQKPGVTREELIEQIDIGGPSMLRSAAKNYASVTVIVDPADYEPVLEALSGGGVSLESREALAAKVFRHTASYDALIASYFTKEEYPEQLTLAYEKKQSLRYGENPQQTAALYSEMTPRGGIASAIQLHGKALSYNNLGDADIALEMVKEFELPAAVAIKHMNPCGVGLGGTVTEAYLKAYASDPVSIFGGIVAINGEVDASCAKAMSETFLEIIIAARFSEEALALLKEKKNLRLLQADMSQKSRGKQLLSIGGGLLIQERDSCSFEQASITVPTLRKPTEAQLKAAKFAWTVVKYVKSNAIVIAKDQMTLGIGPGQTNRIGAAKIAIGQAGAEARDAVLASDAFFPMPDVAEEAAKAGIALIIQPGGSIKDEESIKVCDAHNIAMIFTGVRHFKH